MKGREFYVDICDNFREVIFLKGIPRKGNPIRMI